ncbi:uncharacterized protein LOC109835511 [Asparagus officinalis]|uniref:uncharacterized protein LOC109835511 n=1 Tax=Asparagus officinalis TaxID=4686 RepID=UPI00098E0EDF|nr:uncharacterized protein LOC109835511 [Asparagus officinalis]
MAKKKKRSGRKLLNIGLRSSSPNSLHSEDQFDTSLDGDDDGSSFMGSTGPKGEKMKKSLDEILKSSDFMINPQQSLHPTQINGVQARHLYGSQISGNGANRSPRVSWAEEVEFEVTSSDFPLIQGSSSKSRLNASVSEISKTSDTVTLISDVRNTVEVRSVDTNEENVLTKDHQPDSEDEFVKDKINDVIQEKIGSGSSKTFVSLVSDNRKSGNGLSLSFIPSSLTNTASFTADEWKQGEELWKNALIGHVIGLNVKFKSMESYVNKLWGKISIPKTSLIKQGLFLFDFQTQKQMNDILEAGPWFFGSRPLMLKPWSIDTDIEKFQDFSYPMWVQFPRLKLNLWSSTGISKISSLIGKPITTDKLTATRQRLSYARVLIEVKLPFKEPLPDSLKIEGPDGKSYMQQVFYEFKPKWCSTCCMVGHDTEQCRKNKTKKMWVPVNRQTDKAADGNVVHVSNPGPNKESLHENVITSFPGSMDHVISSANQETKSVEKHAQNGKHAHEDSAQTSRDCEGNFGLSQRDTIPISNQYMQMNDHALFSSPIASGFQLISPTVNASGFTNVNRNNIARRVNITAPVTSGTLPSLFSPLEQQISDPSCADRALLETKLSETKLQGLANKITKSWKWVSNVQEAGNGRIWILWDNDILKIQNVIFSEQCITCTVESRDGRFFSLCTIVYASNHLASRKNLWRDLLTLKQGVNSPWIIGGDFNAIASCEEKIGGLPVTESDTEDFQNFINAGQLLHLRSTGSLITIEDDISEGKRPFKFFNMWVKHPDFISTVHSIWDQSSEGYNMFRFHTKLKKLKHALKELNKNHFMNISEQVCRAKEELADIQKQLNDDLFNSVLIAKEKECIKKYDRLIDCESSYFKQKANINWSLQGDKGSRFFHSIMKKKRHLNRILTLYTDNGSRITNRSEIIAEIINYYKKIMGTSVPTATPDPEVIANGPLLSSEQRQILSLPVAREEIKQTVLP